MSCTGPTDFTARDAEFERVVPLMARVLPDEVMRTIADLIELHSLTEGLDQEMAAALNSADLDERSYRAAWLAVGRRADRERQLALLLAIGRALDRHTRSKLLATTLRVMRGPAQAAGLGRLQCVSRGRDVRLRRDGRSARTFCASLRRTSREQSMNLFVNK